MSQLITNLLSVNKKYVIEKIVSSFPLGWKRNFVATAVRLSSDSTNKPPSRTRKLTALELGYMKRKGEKIAMITAYDFPSAKHAEYADFEIVLVGDSLGMVILGYENTQPVTMEDMLHHCKAVRRGAPTRFIVGDMPFGSYESGSEEALRNALRFIKEAGMDAVKLEGGGSRIESVRKLVDSGVPVMGHVGLTPQAVGVLGGFRAQGRTSKRARAILDDALSLQAAGAFAVVIECTPAIVAQAVTDALSIPTIGIGCGPHTDGQVLVYHDLLGIFHHPHHLEHVPKFCKQYAKLGGEIHNALIQYKQEVHSKDFPTEALCPYKMSEEEEVSFKTLLQQDKDQRERERDLAKKKMREADEYDVAKLY
mmetsp:Transcript_6371/g.6586  ORF Transcript_6371/g.6586 Transcript_6371/m.6586 type:complete len:366 (-) Transcript_6371:112-1209(-)